MLILRWHLRRLQSPEEVRLNIGKLGEGDVSLHTNPIPIQWLDCKRNFVSRLLYKFIRSITEEERERTRDVTKGTFAYNSETVWKLVCPFRLLWTIPCFSSDRWYSYYFRIPKWWAIEFKSGKIDIPRSLPLPCNCGWAFLCTYRSVLGWQWVEGVSLGKLWPHWTRAAVEYRL